MGTTIEGLDGHEGYGARCLPDGTLTAGWSVETARFDAYVAACDCGWHGGQHPPTDEGYQAAVDQWELDHARPLLATTVPPAVRAAIAEAKRAVAGLSGQRPEAAGRVAGELGEWAADLRRRIASDDPAPRRTDGRPRRPAPGATGSRTIRR